ncbi:DUF4381 domain-containing protein [Thiohalocapsa sp. ML1]|jgi:hypothetical protein|uniref:DUF4381 domain-containing protein n=1 Tax=Thiohalocapsa sp. ML1 TaxID=1431688 RepID=UPI0007322243|nr:DUF4381 domain-containing protein [Thiohalocapsa sp. ML1]
MNADPLAGLRDYHLPEPLHWWPPAPGWWLVALLAGVGLALWWRRQRRRRQRTAASALALAELAQLRSRWQADGNDLAFLRGLSALLRRYVLARYPADAAAGLTGAAWIDYLRRKCADAPAALREGLAGNLGEALTESAYRPAAAVDAAALADAAAALFRHGAAAGKGSAPC